MFFKNHKHITDHLWPRLNHKILDVALLCLWFCSIGATKSDPNPGARFGLDQRKAEDTIEQLSTTIRSWRNVFEDCKVPGRDIDLVAPSFGV